MLDWSLHFQNASFRCLHSVCGIPWKSLGSLLCNGTTFLITLQPSGTRKLKCPLQISRSVPDKGGGACRCFSQDWTLPDVIDNTSLLLTMDIIHECLSLAPVPYLGHAFSVLRFIWSSIQQIHASKQQLKALALSIAQLLRTLDREYCAGWLLQVGTSKSITDLSRFVRIAVSWTFDIDLYHTGSWRRSKLSSRRRHHALCSSPFSQNIR